MKSSTICKELDKALRSAFPTRGNLERMLMYQLGWSLNDIVGETAGPKEAVLHLLRDARAENKTAQLVEGAHRANGTNGLLHAYYLRCFSLDRPSGPVLEKIVREELQFHNYAEWLERQQKILRQVCRIEVDGRPAGTGFLVCRGARSHYPAAVTARTLWRRSPKSWTRSPVLVFEPLPRGRRQPTCLRRW